MAFGDQPFPRQRRRDRNIEAFDESAQRIDSVRVQYAGTGEHDDLLVSWGVEQTDRTGERVLVDEPGGP